MPFKIVRNDITKMQVDAIVNAANTALRPGGGVCGAIFNAAGYDALEKECSKIGHCPTGSAVITSGGKLYAKYIIHTPGPVYRSGNNGEEILLRSCYTSSLELAYSYNLSSIAFPLISSGIYGYPKKEALKVAIDAILSFPQISQIDVYLIVYDKNAFEISSKLFSDVEEYIDSRLIVEEPYRSRFGFDSFSFSSRNVPCSAMPEPEECQADYCTSEDISELIKSMDKSFSESLLDLIDKSGMTDAQVYKKANISRKLFSKIRSNPYYHPSKPTAVAFAVALELDLDSALELLSRAGMTLSHSSKFDIIIEYFINKRNYNIFEINEVLFAFDQPLIGA